MNTTIYLIRHGESDGNAAHIFCGQTNVPLTPRGVRQAEITGAYMRQFHLDAVYASDLIRAFKTGSIIANCQFLSAIPDPQLREIHGGAWENQNYDWIGRHFPAELAVWQQNVGCARCPGGESVVQVQQRITRRIRELARENSGKVLGLATHALAIRAFVGFVLQKQPDTWHEIPWATNASVTTVSYAVESDTFSLLQYSADAHLSGLQTQSLT